ncbi:MAG: cyclic nucleotide-binding domain-containing protein [Magnetococcales bacterium]|nr:cyclic nucleotide-binding domain-containing protein [Magnetococcales bacterium]MBF0438418.1 cyclic nucleotide-binding domain-containing protein [Magnetococcales bacterium]
MSILRKINVIPGVFWVEIPEINLYILCGCPADVVKHLMKRGLIIPTEKNGVICENGPNAILLSDILIQNGHISNLSEFPVLQMLYRQGMILPNHPNNTGIKPLLMGSETQVKRQMQYIFRGNYGLISTEELMAAGATAEEAEWMMSLKLRFAFGQIRPTESLLDGLTIADREVEIRSGAWIARITPNVFRIRFRDATITVDLNLPLNQVYLSPYPLGYNNLRREYFAVVHSGQGDGWDSENPSMSSVLIYQGKIYLVDVGPNLVSILNALGISISEVHGLFHSHAHDDHFAGITTLIRAGHRIKYFATSLVLSSVSKKLSALLGLDEHFMEDFFEICPLTCGIWNDIEGLEVKPLFSPHPVETSLFVFRARGPNGYRSYAHWADLASLEVLEGMVRQDPSVPGISQEFFEKIRDSYLTPTNLKKIDIGGGLIHGRAQDYKGDHSEKVIFAHSSEKLTPRQKEIGSSATFGTMDILIGAIQEYPWKFAHVYLKSYYEGVSDNRLMVLLNNPVRTFNPGTIIIHEKETHGELFLVLTGIVEQIQEGTDLIITHSAGSIVGDISAMHAMPAIATFRTNCFVQCLCIPGDLYRDFIIQNNLYENFERLQDFWTFLRTTWIFGESVNLVNLTRIAMSIERILLKTGEVFLQIEPDFLYVVQEGSVERLVDGVVTEVHAVGDFFGEESVLMSPSAKFTFRANDQALICKTPATLVSDIPIVRWKLLEVVERRRGITGV